MAQTKAFLNSIFNHLIDLKNIKNKRIANYVVDIAQVHFIAPNDLNIKNFKILLLLLYI